MRLSPLSVFLEILRNHSSLPLFLRHPLAASHRKLFSHSKREATLGLKFHFGDTHFHKWSSHIISCLDDFLAIYHCKTNHSKTSWLSYPSYISHPVSQEFRPDSRYSSLHATILGSQLGWWEWPRIALCPHLTSLGEQLELPHRMAASEESDL